MTTDSSTSVLDALAAQLGPDTIQKISSHLGTDAAATSNAVSMAIPILLGGLSKNASTADGAAASQRTMAASSTTLARSSVEGRRAESDRPSSLTSSAHVAGRSNRVSAALPA